ncbi:transcription elongation factor SPT5, putative [Entamoeba invadens IP1]|uniref:Transcription elongation factor SPT5, putative n=1 Tax=Entamoeba invadens IP1 TaxID=370355 RepID=A0A0A1UG08_ENTIV|nr:transcription elongation factor SPT5, putative [Entamoeba invadens IP1]ELP94325.1 transcription elongation factor SPT5, putative [Entamoeba invadens IP1]|eukprot:XP_004261096.1 transcription elongation factor SPT5, putative [Entamoeba invadens IP1]
MSEHKTKRRLQNESSEEDENDDFRKNAFIEDEAIEDDEDESEEMQMTEQQRKAEEEARQRYNQPNRARVQFLEKISDPKKYAEMVEQRDVEENEEVEPQEVEENLPERDYDKSFPVFAVKCRPGYETDIAMRVMKLWITNKDRPMHMFSVFVPVEKKGVLYVEALDKPKFVDACEGVRDIYVNTCTQLTDEQIKELLISRVPDNIEVNTYVRVATGDYKNDIGVVVQIEENKKIKVRLVPRFDIQKYQTIAKKKLELMKEEDEEGGGVKKRRFKVEGKNNTKQMFDPQKLGIADAVEEIKNDDMEGVTIYKFNGQTYYDGFVYKSFPVSSLQFNNIVPTDEELIQFNVGNEMQAKGKLRFGKTRNFKVGDLVTIINSDERVYGKKSKIVQSEGEFVVVVGNEIKDPLRMTFADVQIYFNSGDRVKVTDGMYKGETGIIDSLKDDEVFVLTDRKKALIVVSMIDIENTKEIGQQINELNGYSVNDFVQLSSGAGLVLEILADSNRLVILNDANQTIKIEPSLVQGKFPERRDARCKDCRRNFVSLGDKVKIVGGNYKGREATLIHIFQFSKVFLTCPGVLENNSYIVAQSKEIQGPNTLHNAVVQRQDRRIERHDDRDKFQEPRSSRGLSFREMKGKKVTISEGIYKNYKGKIVNMKGNQFVIELDANQRNINLEQEQFKVLDNSNNGTFQRSYGNFQQTPFTPSSNMMSNTPSTPATPGRNVFTPATPAVQTPSQSAFTNVNQTPRFLAQTPKYTVSTPMQMAPPMTPGVGRMSDQPPMTPGVGRMTDQPPRTPAQQYFKSEFPQTPGE